MGAAGCLWANVKAHGMAHVMKAIIRPFKEFIEPPTLRHCNTAARGLRKSDGATGIDNE
jgi:hypothetical protein